MTLIRPGAGHDPLQLPAGALQQVPVLAKGPLAGAVEQQQHQHVAQLGPVRGGVGGQQHLEDPQARVAGGTVAQRCQDAGRVVVVPVV
jgi:hypothetical protein